MFNPATEKELAKIPRLYETEDVPAKNKVIHLHFFIGNSDWFIAEYDGKDTFFFYDDFQLGLFLSQFRDVFCEVFDLARLVVPGAALRVAVGCFPAWRKKNVVSIDGAPTGILDKGRMK